MARRGDQRRRDEVRDQVETQDREMDDKAEQSDDVVSDAETIRDTINELDFGGTVEGMDGVEQSIESASDVTAEEFDRQDEQIEQLQEEVEDHEQELQERSDTDQTDLGRLADASRELRTDVPNQEVIAAKEALIDDDEFLKEQKFEAEQARQESERLQQEHQSRVKAARR